MKTYSKNKISKELNGVEYSTHKLSAFTVNREGIKLLKAIVPAFGMGIPPAEEINGAIDYATEDLTSQEVPNTLGGGGSRIADILFMLFGGYDNEDFENLVDTLLGDLSADGRKIEDWSDWFDDHEGDFYDICMWVFWESFSGFFMKTAIVQSALKTMAPTIEAIKDKVMWNTDSKQDSNEK